MTRRWSALPPLFLALACGGSGATAGSASDGNGVSGSGATASSANGGSGASATGATASSANGGSGASATGATASSASGGNGGASATGGTTSASSGGNPAATGDPGPGEYRDDYQTSPEFFTRMSQMVPSQTHGMVRIWYSTNVQGFPLSGPFTAPEGTVAIKPEYDNTGTNVITVVMIKREAGYDPEHSDWYYEARLPDGSLSSNPTPGPASLCFDCHKDSPETDYLRGFAIEN